LKYLIILSLSLLNFTLHAEEISKAEEMVLTGEISSSSKHVVSAPQGSRWQVQIQWMEEEGTVVQKGAPVVVFDGAIEQAQLTQNQENLDRIELEYEQLKLEQEQALINARGVLKIAKMQVEKARIEASVPAVDESKTQRGYER